MVANRAKRIAALCLIILGLGHFASAATLTVAWDRSPDPTVAGYTILYGTASRLYTNSLDVGDTTAQTVSGLLEGKTYYFAVRAYNSAGATSDPSNEVSATTGGIAPPPTISCPAPVATSYDGKPVTVTFEPTVTGGTAPVTSACSPPSGSLFPVGSTALSCTATDALQLSGACISVVTVVDGSQKSKPNPPGQQGPTPTTTDVDLNGSIARLTGKCVSVTFEVAGRTVVTNSSTQYDKGSCNTLNNGKSVTVKGVNQSNASVSAVLIQFK